MKLGYYFILQHYLYTKDKSKCSITNLGISYVKEESFRVIIFALRVHLDTNQNTRASIQVGNSKFQESEY